MGDQREKAKSFAELHVKGDPLILFNAWDAGTAKAAEEAGSGAIATGSYAVALANGFEDGEQVPMEFVLANLARIVVAVDLPVTLDFEGGYSRDQDKLAENVSSVIAAGAVGINFEDRIVEGSGLYCTEEQVARIAAIRSAANASGLPLFINARCDVVLPLDIATHTEEHLEQMIERATAYADAGASGFFAPGLVNPAFIGRLCEASPLPVNILIWPGVPSSKILADLGVARISYGGGAYRTTIDAFIEAGRRAIGWKHSEKGI